MMRPCPHCGSEEVELLGMELEYWVGCLNCHAAGPLCRTKEEAEQKWCAKYAIKNKDELGLVHND